ncbi:MAG TPA: hypothetical protein VFF75_10745 [Methylophilaceae bacterium]|nr:hypothetical protein [Methylophilaceae bacterium]
MKALLYSLILGLLLIATAMAEEVPAGIQAVTSSGDAVVLHPNGRWEFVDARRLLKPRRSLSSFQKTRAALPVCKVAFWVTAAAFPRGTRITTAAH